MRTTQLYHNESIFRIRTPQHTADVKEGLQTQKLQDERTCIYVNKKNVCNNFLQNINVAILWSLDCDFNFLIFCILSSLLSFLDMQYMLFSEPKTVRFNFFHKETTWAIYYIWYYIYYKVSVSNFFKPQVCDRRSMPESPSWNMATRCVCVFLRL